jgi:hypothetical protein
MRKDRLSMSPCTTIIRGAVSTLRTTDQAIPACERGMDARTSPEDSGLRHRRSLHRPTHGFGPGFRRFVACVLSATQAATKVRVEHRAEAA